ncbi:gamma-type small acid-soluble spore protein [Jeotgalibacillus sp. S-D1]|uniref:gamma-type small acid-soluble spore protein n=1 Tax=Jeotgalibacillus sp. S-D1 TaxID=2552189 RepID=UPI00105A4747|nr:gamma-type small acid-soluble spore protein [Jeotgalibacillus sp. S-D1]TDL30651.1 gamma-type small acid-soluble spore protein [Jeotgalibacillus sp. S-D1]
MKKQTNKTASGMNVEKAKQQNAQAGANNQNYGTEFASETNAAEVKRQNQQAEANKKNASQNNQQNR